MTDKLLLVLEICDPDSVTRFSAMCIAEWHVFYLDYYENERWPGRPDLPSTNGLLFEAIIENCWKEGRNDTMESLYGDFRGLEGSEKWWMQYSHSTIAGTESRWPKDWMVNDFSGKEVVHQSNKDAIIGS